MYNFVIKTLSRHTINGFLQDTLQVDVAHSVEIIRNQDGTNVYGRNDKDIIIFEGYVQHMPLDRNDDGTHKIVIENINGKTTEVIKPSKYAMKAEECVPADVMTEEGIAPGDLILLDEPEEA